MSIQNNSCPTINDLIKGVNYATFTANTIDKPLYNLDFFDAISANRVIVGATPVVSSDFNYALTQQSQFILLTTTAATQTITINTPFDMNQDGYNSGDEAVFAMPIKFISGLGLATSTVAQRTVSVEMTDSSGVVFGNGAVQNVPEMVNIMGLSALTSAAIQDITGTDHLIKVSIQKTSQSATKTFTSTRVTLNLPVGSVIAIYKTAIYRSDEDICTIGTTPSFFTGPEGVTLKFTDEFAQTTGELKQITGRTGLVVKVDLTMTPQNLDLEIFRKLRGAKRFSDQGKMGQKVISITIPSNGFLNAASVPGLGQVSSDDDIVITKDVTADEAVTMKSTKGNIVLKNQYKFEKGVTNSLHFHTSDTGKKVNIFLTVKDNSVSKASFSSISSSIVGTVRVYCSNSASWSEATQKAYFEIRNVSISMGLELSTFASDQGAKTPLVCEQIIKDVSKSYVDLHYTALV